MTTTPDPATPTTDTSAPPTQPSGSRPNLAVPALAVPVLVGLAVAVVLGVYGRVHEPTFVAVNLAGFSGPGYVKAWLATLATVLAVVQVLSSMVMYGRFGSWSPSWIGALHRWSGRAAVLTTVPVVVHCLYALGLQYDQTRVLVHSLAGCVFYGAFVTKMLALRKQGLPGWALPVLGSVVFTGLVVLWLTSSLWLFDTRGVRF